MIKYSGQIKQDFLSSEWVNKLQEAGIELGYVKNVSDKGLKYVRT